MGAFKRELRIKENIHTIDVRNHHRICDAQKHLLQGSGNLIEKSIEHELSIEWMSETIKNWKMSMKVNFIDVRIQLRPMHERKHPLQ